ncbi:MAG TPA: diacylglycerol kinase family protein [Candidatus Saccharimonadales bacterium]|nr:diacylglycerol kinase family protein [Candidatus Saccharimonadales bacterium]
MQPHQQFERYIVVSNPKSTNAQNAARRIAELRALAPPAEVIVVETSAEGRLANMRLLRQFADKLGERTLLCIAAGDGTINSIIEGLLSDPELPETARQTPVLPLWCGNANDLAHMLNGRAYKAKLSTLVTTGKLVKIFPICCTLTDKNGKVERRLAACYVSFGASAYTTKVLAKAIRQPTLFHRWPMGRFLQELGIVIGAMRQAPPFAATEDGQQKTIFEYIFFNGPRFAKVEGVKRRLADKSFHRVAVGRKRLSSIAASLFTLTRRDSSALEATHAAFTTLEPTWAQFDGESADIPEGTLVEITVADKPFIALATRL